MCCGKPHKISFLMFCDTNVQCRHGGRNQYSAGVLWERWQITACFCNWIGLIADVKTMGGSLPVANFVPNASVSMFVDQSLLLSFASTSVVGGAAFFEEWVASSNSRLLRRGLTACWFVLVCACLQDSLQPIQHHCTCAIQGTAECFPTQNFAVICSVLLCRSDYGGLMSHNTLNNIFINVTA
jgi:hypothetical protein